MTDLRERWLDARLEASQSVYYFPELHWDRLWWSFQGVQMTDLANHWLYVRLEASLSVHYLPEPHWDMSWWSLRERADD